MGQRGDGEGRLGLELQPDTFTGNMGIPQCSDTKNSGGHDQRNLISNVLHSAEGITEWSELEETLKIILFQPPAIGRTPSRAVWTQVVTWGSSEGSAVPRSAQGTQRLLCSALLPKGPSTSQTHTWCR